MSYTITFAVPDNALQSKTSTEKKCDEFLGRVLLNFGVIFQCDSPDALQNLDGSRIQDFVLITFDIQLQKIQCRYVLVFQQARKGRSRDRNNLLFPFRALTYQVSV